LVTRAPAASGSISCKPKLGVTVNAALDEEGTGDGGDHLLRAIADDDLAGRQVKQA
jgi:hypothetical protein